MTARRILRTAPADLVPASQEGRSKLPQRALPPKNTIPSSAVEELMLRISSAKDITDSQLLADAIQQALKDR
jgi:hypothetical protein